MKKGIAVIADMELIGDRLSGTLEEEERKDGRKEKVNGEEKETLPSSKATCSLHNRH